MQNTNKNLIFGGESKEDEQNEISLAGGLPKERDEYMGFEKNAGENSLLKSDNSESVLYGREKEEVIHQISSLEAFDIKKKLLKIKNDIDEVLRIFNSKESVTDYEEKLAFHFADRAEDYEAESIEGIFDGARMLAQSGEKFNVPPNYASKSKLVEGDILKLRIMPNGVFKYKQIEKVERKNIIGNLGYNEETNEYFVIMDNGKKYHVLSASITYYKAHPGDEIVITIPRDRDSVWAAVENVKTS